MKQAIKKVAKQDMRPLYDLKVIRESTEIAKD